MVKYDLNEVFHSLADPTRRDILTQTIERSKTISELVERYDMSFVAVAKHVAVLERAQLVRKQRRGREQLVQASPSALRFAASQLQRYEQLWNNRFDHLEEVINKE